MAVQQSSGQALVAEALGDRKLPAPGGGAPLPIARAAARKPRWLVRLRRDRSLLLMVLPALLLLIIFNYLPMFGLATAFQFYTVYSGFLHSPWVGLANFHQLFADPAFWHSLWLTFELFTVQLVLFFPIPIVLAIMLDRVLTKWLRNLVQAIISVPNFFNWVLVITLFDQMFGGSGLLDTWLRNHGATNPFDFMTNAHTFPLLVSSQLIWKQAGYSTILFTAVMAGVSPELYEAAAADGAGRWWRTWNITVPAMMPISILLLILNLGYALTFGFQQMLIQLSAVGTGAAEVVTVYAYEYGIVQGQFSYGAAAGMFISVVSAVMLLGANWVAHRFGQPGLYVSDKTRAKRGIA